MNLYNLEHGSPAHVLCGLQHYLFVFSISFLLTNFSRQTQKLSSIPWLLSSTPSSNEPCQVFFEKLCIQSSLPCSRLLILLRIFYGFGDHCINKNRAGHLTCLYAQWFYSLFWCLVICSSFSKHRVLQCFGFPLNPFKKLMPC